MNKAIYKKRTNSLAVTLAALISVLPVATIAHEYKEQREEIERQLPGWLAETDTPSAAVAFIENGKVQWTVVAGRQSPGVPATANTLYNVASLAKPVTAELMLQLSNNEPALLRHAAAKFWQDPHLAGHPLLPKMTIQHLLTHQSGLPNWRYQTDDKLTFLFEPGTQSGYSGEGYQYLALVMQNKWQKPFEQLMKQHVFAAFGMNNSAFTKQPWFHDRVAHPQGPEGKFGEPMVRDDFNAADDLYTTIGDYGQFVAAVMSGEGLTEPLASQRWQIDFNLAPGLCQSGRLTKIDCPTELGFAMGWTRMQYDDRTLYMQGGGDWGERALAVMVPGNQSGIVVLTNGANGMQVIRKLVHQLLPHQQFEAFLTMQAEG